jgi:hypothetical protein
MTTVEVITSVERRRPGEALTRIGQLFDMERAAMGRSERAFARARRVR